MRLVLVFGLVGQLVRYFSAAFLPPMVLALFEQSWDVAGHFVVGCLASYAVGTLLSRGFAGAPVFRRSEALAVVSFTWLSFAMFAATPYLFAGLRPADALFEAMSGMTATGATILTDFELYGRPFFLWRAMTQWFGGLGVIALFVVVLPRLGIAGRQLFFAEASDVPSESISPRIRDVANRLWMLYVALTMLAIVSLLWCGMPLFESVVHALTTLSAGGFSPNGRSIAGYGNPAAEWVLIGFMLLAGTSFTLQFRVFTGRPLGFLTDPECRVYLGVAVLGAVVAAWIVQGGVPHIDTLRMTAFQSASLISSTGYASTDYNQWSDPARAVLIGVMVVGSCAGSAGGGAKVIRLVLVFRRVMREITRVLHPRAVLPLRHNHQPVPEDVARAVFALVVLYWVGYFVIGLLLVLLGSDMVTGFTAALACLGNIGPALGPAGPMGSYAGFSDAAKLLLTFAMWLGRLEIVTVLALLHPDVWRDIRLRD